MLNIGLVDNGSTITIPVSHSIGTGAAGSFSTPLVVGDLDIYDASAGINLTQRSSSAGFAVDDSFDGVTGLSVYTIDLSDDTDAGFYSPGKTYIVSLTPSGTIDSVSVASWVATFTIESASQKASRTYQEAVFITDTVANDSGNNGTTVDLQDFLDAQAADDSTAGELYLWQDADGGLEYFRVVSMTSLVATVESWPAGGSLPGGESVAATDKLWRVGYVDMNTVAISDTQQTAGDVTALVTTVDTVVDNIKTDTAAILVDTAVLGSPAGASMSADIAAVKSDTAGIQADLNNGTDGLGAIKTDTAAILVDTAVLGSPVGASISADIAAVDTAVDGIQADLNNGTDGLGAIKTDTAAILVDTGATIPATITAVKSDTADILDDTANSIPTSITAVKSDTANILVDTGTTIPNTLGTPVGGDLSTDIAAVDTVVDAILVDTATLGAPVGASISADIAAVKTDSAAILDDTANSIPTSITGVKNDTSAILVDTSTTIPATIGTPVGADLANDIAAIDTVVDGIQADLDNATDGLGAIKADTAAILVDTGTTIPAILGTPSVDLAADIAAVDTDVGALQSDLSNGVDGLGAIKADTAAILIDTGTTIPSTIGTPSVDLASDIAALDTDVNAIKVETAAILVDTGTTIPSTLGTPAGASVSVDLAAIKTDTAATLVDTGSTIPTEIAAIDTVVNSIQTDLSNGTDGLGAIKADTAAILEDTGTSIPSTIATLDTAVDGIQADLSNATDGLGAIKTETAAIKSETSTIKSDTGSILIDTGTTIPATLGTPVGADISADIATVDTVVDGIAADAQSILVDTGTTIPATLGTPVGANLSSDIATNKTDLDSLIAAIITNAVGVDLAADILAIDAVVDAIEVITAQMRFTKANELDVNAKSFNSAGIIGNGNSTPWDGE